MHRAIAHILECGEPFCLLSQQSSDLPAALWHEARGLFKALMSAEHGFFGSAAAGEDADSTIHPLWQIPIHSLYGQTRKPTPEMLAGIRRIVVDLQDIGVRCYTYFATLKNVLEAASENSIAVSVVDRPIPVGGPCEGPMMEEKWRSFVGPANVPMRHAMTPGECAVWLMHNTPIGNLDLSIVELEAYDHSRRGPWPNFLPPSPGIKSWDAAAIYPATVFTEAFPAIGCDRAGTYAFRVISHAGMRADLLADELSASLFDCGFTVRSFSTAGCDSLLLRLADGTENYRPCEAGLRILATLLRHTPSLADKSRPEWMAKLYGSMDIYEKAVAGEIDQLAASWRHPPFNPVKLY